MQGPEVYVHDLGKKCFLKAFSVDPQISYEDLRKTVLSKEKASAFESTEEIYLVKKYSCIEDFEFLVEGEYEFPKKLVAFKNFITLNGGRLGLKNGNVLIVKGKLALPLKFMRGGYYDYLATTPSACPEFFETFFHSKKEKFELEVLESARYLGFAYLLLSDNGKELSFVQRGKEMVFAPDIIASSGSTPNPPLGCDFQEYFKTHISEELSEEYSLTPSEFSIGRVFIFEDLKRIPFLTIEIKTFLTTQELAEKIYGKKSAFEEHPVIYSIPLTCLSSFLSQFSVFPQFRKNLEVFMNNLD